MGKKTDETTETSQELDNTAWPAWFYGPDGDAEIFDAPEDVPEGWEDHPKPALDL
jgi:hypothetical protein